MMTLEYLTDQKEKYQQKQKYFNDLSFDNLAAEFECVVDLIGEMEDYIKERENG